MSEQIELEKIPVIFQLLIGVVTVFTATVTTILTLRSRREDAKTKNESVMSLYESDSMRVRWDGPLVEAMRFMRLLEEATRQNNEILRQILDQIRFIYEINRQSLEIMFKVDIYSKTIISNQESQTRSAQDTVHALENIHTRQVQHLHDVSDMIRGLGNTIEKNR